VATKKRTKAPAKKAAKRKAKDKKCSEKEICAYLKSLSDWLNGAFYNDYAQLQAAVCNLDRVVTRGLPNNPLWQMCPGGGGGTEPPAPPKPPAW